MDDIRIVVKNNNLDALKLLINNENLQDVLGYAIKENNIDMVKYIISQGAIVQTSYSSFELDHLDIAIKDWNVPMIEYLLSHTSDIHLKHVNYVISYYDLKLFICIVQLYLQKIEYSHVIVDSLLFHTLHDSQTIYALKIIEYLITLGADIQTRDYRLLLYAISYHQMHIVQMFFVDNHPPEEIIQEGLICAIITGHIDVVKYMIEHGGKINLPGKIHKSIMMTVGVNVIYRSPMDVALECNNQEIISYLKSL